MEWVMCDDCLFTFNTKKYPGCPICVETHRYTEACRKLHAEYLATVNPLKVEYSRAMWPAMRLLQMSKP